MIYVVNISIVVFSCDITCSSLGLQGARDDGFVSQGLSETLGDVSLWECGLFMQGFKASFLTGSRPS